LPSAESSQHISFILFQLNVLLCFFFAFNIHHARDYFLDWQLLSYEHIHRHHLYWLWRERRAVAGSKHILMCIEDFTTIPSGILAKVNKILE
jgi:hypothetical protein